MNAVITQHLPTINPILLYLALGGMILMIVCCTYLALTKGFRKKGRIGKDRKEREKASKNEL